MASILTSVPGTGNKIPVERYVAGVTELYPNAHRKRIVETSINSKS